MLNVPEWFGLLAVLSNGGELLKINKLYCSISFNTFNTASKKSAPSLVL